jgi:peptidoglycan hydrolase-like protein with peptidoglycan-binding domain
MGSQSAAVRSLQHLLIRKFSISCGTSGADGDFGKNTQSAVKTFQKRKGLPVTGICDKDTWTALLVG